MSHQRTCPNCHYSFLKKKDFIDHVTFSSCAENLQDLLVLCPHCNKQFPDEDSLSYHISRNEFCSYKQDQAIDVLNRLPTNNVSDSGSTVKETGSSSKRHKTVDGISDSLGQNTEVVHIQQGALVGHHVGVGTKTVTSKQATTRTMNKTFVSLDVIQGATREDRPFFPIETLHHTQAWRQASSLDQSVFLHNNKDLMLDRNVQAVPATNSPSILVQDYKLPSVKGMEETQCSKEYEIDMGSKSRSPSESESLDDNVENTFDGDDDQSQESRSSNQHIEVWDRSLKDVLYETASIQTHHSRLLFSDETICLTDLYATLNRRGIPATLFDTLSKWAWNNRKLLSKMNEPPMKRKKYLKLIRSTVRGTDKTVREFHPTRTLIELSSGRQVYITTIGFESMIKDLLSNTTLMRPEHILWNDEQGCKLSEINTGSWWSKATAAECNTEMDVLWPLIMFIDGMKISNLGSLRLEPITFTFSRFKREIRNQGNAWRTAAFIEEVHQVRGVDDEDLTANEKNQDYHDILRFIFSELVVLQERGIAWTFSEYCGDLSNRRAVLRLPIQLIIGDCEGHDKLCGRYKSHSQGVKGLCRDCDIPTKEADNVDWRCRYRTSRDLATLTPDQLADISFYALYNNALHTLSFGGTDRGFFAGLLAENLHVIKSGLIPVIFDGIWSSLSKKATKRLHYGARFFVNIHKGIESKFSGLPPINAFRYGLTAEKSGGPMTLDSSEKFGRVFLLYCLLTISPVLEYICRHQKRGTYYDYRYWSNIIHMLEMTLAFEAWVCSKEHEKQHIIGPDGKPETGIAHRRIRQFLHKLKTYCPTLTNAEFRTTKFHQCLHFPMYIDEHGSMLNCDSNRPESMAIKSLKDPASHTQGRHNTLSYQTGIQYLNQLTVMDAQRIIEQYSTEPVIWSEPFKYINPIVANDDNNSRVDGDFLCTGTRFDNCYWYDNDEDAHYVRLLWKNKGELPMQGFDNAVIAYVSERLFNAKDGGRVDGDTVPGFTTLIFKDGRTFNAHPYSRNERPRHDWVMIRWSEFDDPVPARIEMFLDLTSSDIKYDNMHIISPDSLDDGSNNIPVLHQHKSLTNSVYAIVASARSSKCDRNHLSKFHITTSLCNRVQMEPFLRIVEVTSFEQKCLAFSNTIACGAPDDSTAIVFHGTDEWPSIFLNGCPRS